MNLFPWFGSSNALAAIIGWAVGMAVGFILGFIVFLGIKAKSMQVVKRWQGKVLGIVYDVDNDEWDMVGLDPIGREVYYSNDPHAPLIVVKPAVASTQRFKLYNKPAMFIVAKKLHGFSNNPENLAKIGLASLTIGDIQVASKEAVVDNILSLMDNLLTYTGEKTGVIKVNPNLRIGIAIKPPEVVRAITNFITSLSYASLSGLKDNLLSAEKFAEYMKKMELMPKMGKSNFLTTILIAGGVLGILWWIITHIYH